MNNKANLIQSLQLAIDGLKTGTLHYNWTLQNSCNCGVVVQAILGVSPQQLSEIATKNRLFVTKEHDNFFGEGNSNYTWREAVQMYCPMTGEPLAEIFKQLKDRGFTKEDIAHLEFMTNAAILKKSGIDVAGESKIESIKVKVGTKKVKKGFFKKAIVEDVYEMQLRKTTYNYYTIKENLITYLSAWASILKEKRPEISDTTDVDILRRIELHAVADEDYETAQSVRNKINSLQ